MRAVTFVVASSFLMALGCTTPAPTSHKDGGGSGGSAGSGGGGGGGGSGGGNGGSSGSGGGSGGNKDAGGIAGSGGSGSGGSGGSSSDGGGISNGTSCADLTKCINDCGGMDSTCVMNCQTNASPEASALQKMIYDCLNTACSSQCDSMSGGTGCMDCLCGAQCSQSGACRMLNEMCAGVSPDPDCKASCNM